MRVSILSTLQFVARAKLRKRAGLVAGQARFRQIEVALNSAQRPVVDDPLVTQIDNDLPLNPERLLLQLLILRRGYFAAAILRTFQTTLQLSDPIVIFGAQTGGDLR